MWMLSLIHIFPVSTGLITAKSLSTPRYPGIDGAYYGKILICAPMYKGGGYNRPDFVSHTRFRKFCWVQIACFCLPYPRQHKYIKILTGRCLRCPSVFLSVNIYFVNDLSLIHISPEGRRRVAYLPSFAINCALLPAERTSWPPLPGYNSTIPLFNTLRMDQIVF